MNALAQTLKRTALAAGLFLAGLTGGEAIAQDEQPSRPKAIVIHDDEPAEQPVKNGGATTRTEVEVLDKVDQLLTKVTGGASPVGKGKHAEYIRSYSYFGHKDTKTGEQEINYTALSAKTPELKLKNTRHEVNVFGMIGTSEGWGFETKHRTSGKIPFLELTLNAEGRTTKDNEALRLGAGLDYRKEGLTIGGAFDTVTTEKDRTNQYLLHGTYNLTKVDMIGSALELKTNPAGNTEKAGIVYTRYGPNESWGTRTWGAFTNNHATDTKTAYFTSIVSQNPTWTRGAAELIVGRGPKEIFDDARVVENVLGAESGLLQERTRQGWALQPELSVVETPKGRTTSAAGYASYTFDVKGVFIGPKLSYSMKFTDAETTDRAGTMLLIKKPFKKGSLLFEAGYSDQFRAPKGAKETSETYFRAGFTFDW